MNEFKIGDRVKFTEYACSHANVGGIYLDADMKEPMSTNCLSFYTDININMDKLRGVIIRNCHIRDVYDISFTYKGISFFDGSVEGFIEIDKVYLRDEKIKSILR